MIHGPRKPPPALALIGKISGALYWLAILVLFCAGPLVLMAHDRGLALGLLAAAAVLWAWLVYASARRKRRRRMVAMAVLQPRDD